jgi:hypothetical protein
LPIRGFFNLYFKGCSSFKRVEAFIQKVQELKWKWGIVI